MNVRVGFSTTNHLLSRLIRWISGSRCSHVWFCFYDQTLACDMVMEAHFTYQLIPLETFQRKNKIINILKPKFPAEFAVRATTGWLGSSYDVAGLLGMTWVQLGRWLHHCWKNPLRSTRSVYCSEAVARGLLTANYPGASALIKDPESVTPDDLLAFFRDEKA